MDFINRDRVIYSNSTGEYVITCRNRCRIMKRNRVIDDTVGTEDQLMFQRRRLASADPKHGKSVHDRSIFCQIRTMINSIMAAFRHRAFYTWQCYIGLFDSRNFNREYAAVASAVRVQTAASFFYTPWRSVFDCSPPSEMPLTPGDVPFLSFLRPIQRCGGAFRTESSCQSDSPTPNEQERPGCYRFAVLA
jgi:hypothetical protein